MFHRASILVTACFLAAAAVAQANDAYYDIPIRELKLLEGKLPERPNEYNWRHYQQAMAMEPYIVLDGPGEGYFTGPGAWGGNTWQYASPVAASPSLVFSVHLRAPQGQEVKGRLVLADSNASGMNIVRFVVPAKLAKPEAKASFLSARVAHYYHLLDRDIPGGAWFRHQARLTSGEMVRSWVQVPRFPREGFLDSYDLFTGGRAISENLQLDRVLPQRPGNETPVKVASLQGITIKEIDWKPLVKEARPALDPLASKIPFDQHAVFFPSFQAAAAMSDEASKHDTPVLRLAQPRAEDAGVVERYQRQLGLSLNTLARMLGPTMVTSAALTGSDPSFPLGTDMAVLLETPEPAMLARLLTTRVALAAADIKGAKPASGTIGGVAYHGFVSPDRKISSYIAQLDGAVVVTNSTYQLQRLAAIRGGKAMSLALLPEYKFFRMRYPRGEADESALIFLSDATIRRWCGARWRIADARRTRARAVLAELQASQAEALARHKVEPGPIHTDLPILGGGQLRLTPDGVVSSVYGTLDFMTPVGEMAMDEVTKDEADAYAQWRDGYQRNWTWSFDPIGLRISLGKKKLATDLTIMPLILNSEYNNFFEISRGAKFEPAAGDPHKSLAQLIVALNHESHMFHAAEGFASMTFAGLTKENLSLGWVGSSISLYADDDPFWNDLAKVDEEKINDFMTKNVGRLPVGLRVDSTSPLQLALFLSAVRAYVEQTGPGLTRWESLKYKDQGYVRVSAVKGQRGVSPEVENMAVYYTTVGGALTVTFSERVLQHAIDRSLDGERRAGGVSLRAEAASHPEANASGSPTHGSPTHGSPTHGWLGSNVALHVDHALLEVANALGRRQYEDRMQVQSWNNLPVLNEWKRLFPDRDPVAVHRELWGVTLVCPGGGKYVWNAKYGTMESTVYGHPGQPKAGPPAPPVLSSFTAGDFGLTLENDGLRARVELQRPAK